MLRGLHLGSIDTKGRLMMPGKLRLGLGASGIITIDPEDRCLLMYAVDVWSEIELKLIETPNFNREVRRIQRLLIGHATEVELDAQGRFLVPSILRDYADLTKKVVLVGQGKKIELWSEAQWTQSRDMWLNNARDCAVPELVEFLTL